MENEPLFAGLPIRNETDFYRAVVQMRKWQKEFFKNRSKTALDKAKFWEKWIDEHIEFNTPKKPDAQQSLFNE